MNYPSIIFQSHFNHVRITFQSSSNRLFPIIFEWIAFAYTVVGGYYGYWPDAAYVTTFNMSAQTMVWYLSTGRQIFGLCFSYLVLLMVTP